MRRLVLGGMLLCQACVGARSKLVTGQALDRAALRRAHSGAERKQVGSFLTPYVGGCMEHPSADIKDGTAYAVSGSRMTVPATFNRLQWSTRADSKLEVGSAVDLGIGFNKYWGVATAAVPTPGKPVLSVEPTWFIGAAINGGYSQTPGSSEAGAALSGSLFGGYSVIAVSVGYQPATKMVLVGLATKIDPFKITGGAGSDICVGREAF